MAGKKTVNNKPQKNNPQSKQMIIYRAVFIVISLIVLFSMVLSAVATF